MSIAATHQGKPLPRVAVEVDLALASIDDRVDWLTALSPLDNDQMWEDFQSSGYRKEPRLRYRPRAGDLHDLRRDLFNLPVEDIKHPKIQALFWEKQRELDKQIELLTLANTEGFVLASIDLFGGCGPKLMETAQAILDTVAPAQDESDNVGSEFFREQAETEMDWYRARFADFDSQVIVDADLNSLMMVSRGHLHIASSLKIPLSRVGPLIAHEIGTHVVSRYNGRQQPIHQLEVGLAHYNPLQEGLGTLSEYLAGYLPAARLRVIAARVVAVRMAIEGSSVVTIFSYLHENYRIEAEDAFDIAVRACRGGGLTKDAVYLRGLTELLNYLANGGDLEILFLGKFALAQLPVLLELQAEGWVVPPAIIPRHLQRASVRERLAQVRKLSVQNLFQGEPGQ